MREFWQRWKGLLPAILIASAIMVSLALTQPELQEIPELLMPTAAAETAAESADEPEEEEVEVEELACEDGVYLGTAMGYGGEIEVRVTVDGGEMEAIDVVSADGETEKFFKRARRVIPEMLASNTWEVDNISGATLSVNGIKNAVQNAVLGTSDQKTNVKMGSLNKADGRYIGTAEGYGGDIKVRVTVRSGEIVAVDLLEAEGETETFLTRAREMLTDIQESNTWDVDTISGATYSSRGIQNAVKNALTGASSAESAVADQGDLALADGRYIGAAEGYGGEVRVRVTVQSGRIAAVDILEEDGETDTFMMRARGVLENVMAANSWNVDTVSGATYSSRGILDAIANALQSAEQPAASATEQVPAESTAADAQLAETPAASSQTTSDAEPQSEKKPGLLEWVMQVLFPDDEQPADTSAASSSTSDSTAASEAVSGSAVPAGGEGTAASSTAMSGIMYADGTYTGSAACTRGSRFDYDLTVHFTVKSGVIGEITVTKGEDRSASPQDNESYLTAAISGSGSLAGIPAQIVQKQSADSVDAISGATYSSNAIQTAVQNALAAGPQEANAS